MHSRHDSPTAPTRRRHASSSIDIAWGLVLAPLSSLAAAPLAGCGSSADEPAIDGGAAGAGGASDARDPTADGDAPPPDAESRPDASDAAPPERALADWVGVIGTGQSLSVGAVAGNVISKTQPFGNLKLLDTGPDPKYPLDGGGVLSLVPLVEPFRPRMPGDGQYPGNIYGESPNAGMANEISALWRTRVGGDYVTLHSVVGWSGHCLRDIDKRGGKKAYPAGLSEARTFKRLAAAAGKTLAYGGMILTHGECDSGSAGYAKGLFDLWGDYNTDLKAITGQTRDVVLIASQQSTIPGGAGFSASTLAVWKDGVDYPGKVVCSGPKYQYEYASDKLHFEAPGYRRLGIKYGEVFDAIVNRGVAWKPVQPKSVKREGAKITLDFDVPNPPLQWDERIAPPHQTKHAEWKSGRGFEVVDSTGDLTITSVTLVGGGSGVEITLDEAPTGTGLKVRYAMTQDGAGLQGGTDQGRRGQLRDSDTLVGYDAEMLVVNVVKGSSTITATTPKAFAGRTGRDVVTADGLPADTIVVKRSGGEALTLSSPWSRESGKTTVRIHHDQHNYAVHFELPVP